MFKIGTLVKQRGTTGGRNKWIYGKVIETTTWSKCYVQWMGGLVNGEVHRWSYWPCTRESCRGLVLPTDEEKDMILVYFVL